MKRWLMPMLALVGVAAGSSAFSATNDVFPGDYFPSEPGDRIVSVYAFDRLSKGPYAGGRRQADGALSGRIAALRAVNTFEWLGKTASAVMVLTWADLAVRPDDLADLIGTDSTGLGDLRLGLTIWPIKDRQNANYLGLSAMLIAPTGNYDRRQLLNYAENRWRLVLSGGWQKDITPRWLFERSPEITLYGDNHRYAGSHTLSQSPAPALTGYLRWRATPVVHWHVGGQMNWGGSARRDGTSLDNPPENDRINIGTTWFLPNKQQLIVCGGSGPLDSYRAGRWLGHRCGGVCGPA